MTGDSPRLVVSEGAREAQVALSAYAAAGPVEVRSAVPGMPLPARGAVLVLSLAEARTLLAAPPGAPFMLVLWLARGDKAEPALLSDSHIAGVLRPDPPPDSVHTVLQAAFRLLAPPAVDAARMLEDVLEIGRALAAEKDLDTLLSLILTHARSLTGADGASIYTRDRDGVLYFRLWQKASNAATEGKAFHTRSLVFTEPEMAELDAAKQ